jgi:mannose-1-phosphate guanylyltransferase / mannose-6-phosphate isomerase
MPQTVAVILSGGAGSRLWPASHHARPKPFLRIGDATLLEYAVERGRASGCQATLVVANVDHLALHRATLGAAPAQQSLHYLLEPKGRNTAPAIALAALAVQEAHGRDAVMLVLPADHLVPDTSAFVACTMQASALAQQGQIVAFGVSPTAPETGYGYIEVATQSRSSQKVLRFVEKPDAATAAQYLSSGRFLWNSGMFCFTAQTILQALGSCAPLVLSAAQAVWAARDAQGDTVHLGAALFASMPDVSIDYAVMEKAPNVSVVPARFAWSDVGTWDSIAKAYSADSNGNTSLGDVLSFDTTGTHVQCEAAVGKIVATLGVHDLLIIDTPGALLVASKSHAQDVKRVAQRVAEIGKLQSAPSL